MWNKWVLLPRLLKTACSSYLRWVRVKDRGATVNYIYIRANLPREAFWNPKYAPKSFSVSPDLVNLQRFPVRPVCWKEYLLPTHTHSFPSRCMLHFLPRIFFWLRHCSQHSGGQDLYAVYSISRRHAISIYRWNVTCISFLHRPSVMSTYSSEAAELAFWC